MPATAMAMKSHLVPETDETSAAVDNTTAATEARFTSLRGAVGPAGIFNSGASLLAESSRSGVRIPAWDRIAIAIEEAAISVKANTAIEIARANAE